MRPPALAPLVATLLSAAGATAAPVDAPAVEIVVVGTPDDLDRVRELVGHRPPTAPHPSFSRAETFEPSQILMPATAATVRCWVDLRDARRARLYFASATTDRFVVRELVLSGRFDEMDRAALAEILESSLGALAENDRAGLSRAQAEQLLGAPAALPPPPPTAVGPSPLANAPAPDLRATHVEWGTFYAAQATSADFSLAQGPGASVVVVKEVGRETGGRRFAGGWLTVQYRLPERARSTDAGVRLDTLAARAGVEFGSLRVAARFGLGADVVHIVTEVPSPAVVPAGAHWSKSLVFTAAVRASARLAPNLRGSLLALLDLAPTATDYVIVSNDVQRPVFSPWRLRPGLALERAAF